MNLPASDILISGCQQRPSPLIELRAGPLSLGFEDGGVRFVTFAQREILQGMYATVRDEFWNTIPPRVQNLVIDRKAESFAISFTAEHRSNDIHFVWQTRIEGTAAGTLHYTAEGEAKTTFLRNRIGLCILHPISGCAGQVCRLEYVDGRSAEVNFPQLVAARQPIPGFHDLRSLAHEIAPGLWAEVSLAGEVFETEDQRNWIDASFKTYCTPLSRPRPVLVPAGSKLSQSATLRLKPVKESAVRFSLSGQSEPASSAPVVNVTFEDAAHPLPFVGLQCSVTNRPLQVPALTAVQRNRLRKLGLSHLRVDLRLASRDWPETLAAGYREAVDLDLRLELAIHVDPVNATQLRELARCLGSGEGGHALLDRCQRLLILEAGARSTSREVFAAAVSNLASLGLPMGLGTDGNLYDLDLAAAAAGVAAGAKFIAWSMNPQVHADDNRSMALTPLGAADQLRTMRHRFPGIPLVVSPITIRPRFNPIASLTPRQAGERAAAAPADPRQVSLFGAGWTLAMIQQLAAGEAQSLTFCATAGPRGLLTTSDPLPWPTGLQDSPDAVFPIFHLFGGCRLYPSFSRTQSSEPMKVAALALRNGRTTRLLLANLEPVAQTVRVPDWGTGPRLKYLDEPGILAALRNPEAWQADHGEALSMAPDRRVLTLPPCALAWLDYSPAPDPTL